MDNSSRVGSRNNQDIETAIKQAAVVSLNKADAGNEINRTESIGT